MYGTLNFSDLKKDDVLDAFSGRRVKDQLKGLETYLERISEFPKFIRNNPVHVTDEMIELYMEVRTCVPLAIDKIHPPSPFSPLKILYI